MLDKNAAMVDTLKDIKSLSSTLFYNSLTCHTSKLLDQVSYVLSVLGVICVSIQISILSINIQYIES